MIKQNIRGYNDLFKYYTEVRIQENRINRLVMVNGDLMSNDKHSQSGVSARSYFKGSWGFASNPNINEESIKDVIKKATDNAEFLGNKNEFPKAELPKTFGKCDKDFSTTKPRKLQKDKIAFMQNIDNYLSENYPKLKSKTLVLSELDMEKQMFNSDGSNAYSLTPRTIIYVTLVVTKDEKPYELYEVYGGLGQFEDIFENPEELYPKLDALYKNIMDKAEGIYPVAGYKDVILDADLAGILAHEAIGHTTEADLVKGGSVAGDFLGEKVASELITLVDFAHTYNNEICPVPVFVDDEGTEAKDAVIIKDGILKQFMHSKETALYFQHEPTGNARAYGFYDEPLVRMRNTAILPGSSKLEDMIASIDDGYYLIKSSNGQADSTSEFMFGVVLGYEIKNGKLGKAIKDTTISGIAFDVLKTVTMVSDDMSWSNGGMCGKKQSIPVGMGGPAIKCKINIGGR